MSNETRVAWRVVIVSAIAVFLIFGIRLSFTVFFAEFTSGNGWSSSAAASIFSINMMAFAVVSTPSGVLLDRYGPRVVFSVGAVLLGISLALCSMATSVFHLQITYGVIGGAALAMIGLSPFAAVVAGWMPSHRRGVGIGITFAGSGLGSLLFVPVFEWMIADSGWQQAFLIQAFLALFVLAPLVAVGERRPPTTLMQMESHSKPSQNLLRKPAFWWLLIASFTALSPLRSLTVHQVAYLEDVGVERHIAARYVGIAGFLTAIMFIGLGYISDRIGRARTFVFGSLCMIGAVAILLLLRSNQTFLLLIGYSLLMAIGEGTRSSQTTAIASDTFAQSGLGLINGIVGAMFGFGAAFGPWVVGYLHDETGGYVSGLEVIMLMTVISIISFVMVGKRPSVRRTHANMVPSTANTGLQYDNTAYHE